MSGRSRSGIQELARLLQRAISGRMSPLERTALDKAMRWYMRELRKQMKRQREEEQDVFPSSDPWEDDDDFPEEED